MDDPTLPVLFVTLAIIGFIFSLALILSPLMIWAGVSELRRMLRAEFSAHHAFRENALAELRTLRAAADPDGSRLKQHLSGV